MSRSLALLAALLVAVVALGFGTFRLVSYCCARGLSRPADELAWLRMEFQLSDADMARIRQLHEGYLPVCAGFCAQIAAKKAEFDASLGQTNLPPDVEARLTEIATLRARCQAAMLRHFVEVSQAMPPEQGRRYLVEMQRMTLGAHEQIEAAMAPAAAHEHHHQP